MKANRLFFTLLISMACHAQKSDDVVTERPTPVPAWGVTLIERESCRPESDVCDSQLFVEDSKRKRRLVGAGLTGPFVPLLKARKVFSCEDNSTMETKGPALMGLNGQKTPLPPHPGALRDCSTAGTGEEMLLVYSLADLGKLYSFVRVIGSSGKVLVEKRLDAEGDVDFTVSGKPYRVRIPSPSFPG